MTHKQLDALFTLKVNEYIQKGYLLHTPSLKSLEGNEGKIVLVKGKTYVHISLETDYSRKVNEHTASIVIRIGENMEPDCLNLIWPHEMKKSKRYNFYYFSDKSFEETPWFFESVEEIQTAREKRSQRRLTEVMNYNYKKLPVKSDGAIMRHVRSLKGSKRAKSDDIFVGYREGFDKPITERYNVCCLNKRLYTL